MVKKFKFKIQCIVFDKKFFDNRRKIKSFIVSNGFVVDNRLKRPIMDCGKCFRVRQKNPEWFKKPFVCKSLGKGVKGVYGYLKR